MRGRKPKPTALKQQQGNPGKRRLNRKEPQPERRIPSCPKHLKGAALTEWKRVAPVLWKLGVLTELDRTVLAAYCTAYADYVEACEHVQQRGAVIKARKGGEYQNLWVGIKKRSMDQMVKYAGELGLTPSSRGRVQVADIETNEEKEDRLFPHATKRSGRK